MLIYKILRDTEWKTLQTAGQTDGAPIDVADGYIHFSTAETVAETAAKYFANIDRLMLLAYEADDFSDMLKWEPSRGGALFPHLYAPLPMAGLIWAKPLPATDDGHSFPEGVL